MKQLLILRHAKSDHIDNIDDFDRPLAAKGLKSCKVVADYLKEQTIVPDLIIASSAKRTKETAESVINYTAEKIDLELTKKLYLATPGEMIKVIAQTRDEVNKLMIVCHNPGAWQLSNILTGSGDINEREDLKTQFPTAALAVLQTENSWSQIEPAKSYLKAFFIPKELNKTSA